jgi:hypothetical protein
MRVMSIQGAIAKRDLRLVLVTDDLDEAVTYLERHAIEHFGLRRRRERKPSWWLWERAG